MLEIADHELRERLHVRDVVESAAGGARDLVQQVQIHRVVADADGRDRHVVAREVGDQLVVVGGAAVGVAVGQQDDVADAAAGGDQAPPRALERFLEVRAAAVLELADLRRERGVALGEREERAQLVGLGVEGDGAHQVARAELLHDRQRGALRVLHLGAVREVRTARVAHAVRAVDQEVEGDRLALLRLRALGPELDGEHALESGAREAAVAEEMRAAGGDQRAAPGDPAGERVERALRDAGTGHVLEDDDVIVREASDAGGEAGGRRHLDLHAALRERKRHHRLRPLAHRQHAERRRHGDRGRDRARRRRRARREAEARLEEVGPGVREAVGQADGAHAGRQLDRHGQEGLAVDGDRERGAERRGGAALHHRLERQRGMRGRERGRDQPADRRRGETRRGWDHRIDRHARLGERRLGEQAPLALVAVGEEEEGGPPVVRAEGRRAREGGGEVGLVRLEVVHVAAGHERVEPRAAGGRVRQHARASREGQRAERVARAERRHEPRQELARGVAARAADARRDVDRRDHAGPRLGAPALEREAGERQDDERGSERAARRGEAEAGRPHEEERECRERGERRRVRDPERARSERQRHATSLGRRRCHALHSRASSAAAAR